MFSSVLFWKIILGVVWVDFFLIYPQGYLTITIPHFISSQKKPHNYFPFLSSRTSTVCQYFSGIVHDLVCLGSFLANLQGSTSL